MNTEAHNTPLAIVGIGCLFPKAAGPGFYWANVKHGVDCIDSVPATHWDPADYFDADPKSPDMTYARRGGFLDAVDFNPLEFGIAPRDIEATDTTQLLGLVAAKQALVDAGVVFSDSGRAGGVDPRVGAGNPLVHTGGLPKTLDRSRVSVILGVTGTLELVIPLGARLGHPKWKRAMRAAGIPDEQIEDAAGRIAESYVPWQENSFPGLLGNVVAGRIANRLDLGGTNCVVDAACASSLSAVHLAAMELQTGRADVVVTGGCDTFNDIFMYMCFSKTPALSPSGDAKPFDADGDGTILGEGLGMVVLKRLADAERDGDTVYAVIKGIGSSSDGKGNAIYAPSAEGQRRCLLTAYRAAGVTPGTIELVEAHGTGTKVGDATEATALTEVYLSGGRQPPVGDHAQGADAPRSAKPHPWAAIGSVKSQIGHTKAAAGAASLIKAALALYYKVLPPTIKVARPVEPLGSPDSPFYVNTTMRPWLPRVEHPRRVALSAFGFGGSNFHAVLEEHDPAKREVDWDGSVEVVALGADSPQALAAELAKVPTEWVAFARFAEQTRQSFDASAKCRLCFAAHRTLTDLSKLLAGAKARLAAEPDAPGWHTPEGAHYGASPAAGKLAVLFPGQGSQVVGMLRDLACLFPEVLDTLAEANAGDAADAPRLSDRIYPPAAFDPEAKKQHDADLRATWNAQPALGAVSFGAWRVLNERFGLAADAFAGHSYGELVALAAAGRVGAADLFALSRLRGRLMGEQRAGDPGAMLAVLAPLPDIEQLLHDRTLDLVVANRNAPKQAVLSGSTPEIERAERAFADAGLTCTRLPVAAAFHSRFVADASVPFRAALEGVTFAAGAVPVFANTTAAEYPADSAAARDLLANQLASPVAFVEELRAMAGAGVRTYVEVGPGTVLTRLADATFADAGVSGFEAFALDASGGKRSGVLDLGNVLARLAARGHRVNVSAWEAGSRCRPAPAPAGKPGLTVPLTGANYVTPRAARPPRPAALNGVNGTHASRGGYAPRSLGSLERPALVTSAKVDAMPDPDPNALAQALLMTQQSLAALQRMQEQTAALHKQFLESQETAQRTLQSLVDQQQALLLSGLGSGVPLPAPAFRSPTHVPPVAVTPAPVVPVTVDAPRPVATPVTSQPQKPVAAPAPVNGARVPARDRVAATLLAVVSEKTGYPAESLDLGLSLDGDLGVDSIKRVEILSALQEKLPGAPVVKPEHLGTLHTLRDVAAFLAGPGDPAAAAVPLAPAAGATTLSTDLVSGLLLEVIAEKTGYPAASLDPGLSLDADLGVDSIKRVEILAAVKERLPEAPEVKAEHLGTLRTIRDVAEFLSARSPLTAPSTAKIPINPVAPAADAVPLTPVVSVADVSELNIPDTEQVDSIKQQAADMVPKKGRGSDVARQPGQRSGVENTLRAGVVTLTADRVDRSILQASDLDLNSPRPRVALARGGEIWIVGERDPLADAVAEVLAGQGFKPKRLGWSAAGTAKWSGPLTGLVLIAPPTPDVGLNRHAFAWLKLAAPKLRQTGRAGAALFATVARLDGAFGLANLSADADPTAGGLAGLVKTARHEWPEVVCKAIDLDPAFIVPQAAAAAVADELLTLGPAEVGVARTHRCTLDIAHRRGAPGRT